jgi:hypothetical protein
MFGSPVEVPVLVVVSEIPRSVGVHEPSTAPTAEEFTVVHALGVFGPEALVELPVAVGDGTTEHGRLLENPMNSR